MIRVGSQLVKEPDRPNRPARPIFNGEYMSALSGLTHLTAVSERHLHWPRLVDLDVSSVLTVDRCAGDHLLLPICCPPENP